MQPRYMGMMSGTSCDGVDLCVVEFTTPRINVIAQRHTAYPPSWQETLLRMSDPQFNDLSATIRMEAMLSAFFAEEAMALLDSHALPASSIRAIGVHGQTIRHQPHASYPYTLQLVDANIIAARTGITTVADFRRKDIANGGEGAPFACAFHQAYFKHAHTTRVIVNLGGIANITILTPQQAIRGFDTGPANALLDAWAQQQLNKPYDHDGAWAERGSCNRGLLELMRQDPFITTMPPKSTGKDYFNLAWLTEKMHHLQETVSPVDIQATLLHFTARTVVDAIMQHAPNSATAILCGGGAKNTALVKQLKAMGPGYEWIVSDSLGIDCMLVEALAFAWLAHCTVDGTPVDLTQVTGAKKPAILGGIYASP